MSRAYRIRVAESLTRHIEVSDGIVAGVHLLDLLPRERMVALLAEELVRAGFVLDGDHATRTTDGIEVSVDLKAGQLSVRAVETDTIEVEGELEARVEEEVLEGAEDRIRAELRASLDQQIDAERTRRRQALTRRLEQALVELKPELDRITNRAHVRALHEKAAQMGQVVESTEDPETGAVTVRVRL